MYEKGYGTEVDPKEAEKWYQKAKSGKSIWRADLIHLLFE